MDYIGCTSVDELKERGVPGLLDKYTRVFRIPNDVVNSVQECVPRDPKILFLLTSHPSPSNLACRFFLPPPFRRFVPSFAPPTASKRARSNADQTCHSTPPLPLSVHTLCVRYMEPFDKLRLCCGDQMSKAHALTLLGREDELTAEERETEARTCGAYNLTKEEEKLRSSTVFRQYAESVPALRHVSAWKITDLALEPAEVNGSFCSSSTNTLASATASVALNCDVIQRC